MTESTRTALVTGASRGIGAAIAARLSEDGFKVLGTATGAAGLETIARIAPGPAGPVVGLQLDLGSADSIESLEGAIADGSHRIDVLVNNAGITRDNLLLRMKDTEWQEVIDANLTGVFALSRRFLRGMVKQRWGRMINITSVVGSVGNPGQANYAAAKAGVIGFTKALAREVANRAITVNAIAPGFIDTDMTRGLGEAQRDALLQQIPAGRLGAVDEIAHAVSFLASDQAAYITGQTLHVNGGMYMS